MPRKTRPKIGKAKGNIMPVDWAGTKFKIPLNKNYRGNRYREYSFSPTKSVAKSRAADMRKKGHLAHIQKFTEGNDTLYFVYVKKRY